MEASRRFRVMGTTAHVVAVASGARTVRLALEHARTRLAELEARWSRFVPTSDVSVLNVADGVPVMVSGDTCALVTRAVEGWRRTGGRFDPTIHDSLVALGYDRDFDAIDRVSPDPVTTVPAPGCAGIVVDRVAGTVQLPRGVRLDPGGIGKGLAADLVVDEMVGAGVDGAAVDVGGDVRVAGTAPGGAGWVVDVEHPLGGVDIAQLRLDRGAVASTWRTRRRFGAAGEHHHLLDPATGAPARSGLAGTAVVAARAWWAEVLAKAAFLDGRRAGTALLVDHGVSGYLVDDDGGVHPAGAVAAFAA